MEPLFSKYQCGFRRGFSAQDCLLAMLEKWKSAVDKVKIFGILITDLSKAFDCLSHELIIAKLSAYGFSLPTLKLMQSYLTERKQRLTKLLALGKKYYSEYHKDLHLPQSYSTLF